jgi:hypothetical protein
VPLDNIFLFTSENGGHIINPEKRIVQSGGAFKNTGFKRWFIEIIHS